MSTMYGQLGGKRKNERCYHVHAEVARTLTDEPVAVVCADCLQVLGYDDMEFLFRCRADEFSALTRYTMSRDEVSARARQKAADLHAYLRDLSAIMEESSA